MTDTHKSDLHLGYRASATDLGYRMSNDTERMCLLRFAFAEKVSGFELFFADHRHSKIIGMRMEIGSRRDEGAIGNESKSDEDAKGSKIQTP